MFPLELLVKAVLMIAFVLVPSGLPPHFIPKMNCVATFSAYDFGVRV
jgi:hypothetical protein